MNLTIRILGYPLLEIYADTAEPAEPDASAVTHVERAAEEYVVEDSRVGFGGGS